MHINNKRNSATYQNKNKKTSSVHICGVINAENAYRAFGCVLKLLFI